MYIREKTTYQTIPVFVAIILDITQRKKIENELIRMQKLKSLCILAGDIAHDFNNRLVGILMRITLARTDINKKIGCMYVWLKRKRQL